MARASKKAEVKENLGGSAKTVIENSMNGWIPGSNMIKFRITLIEEMLGTAPSDPNVYTKYISSQAPDAASTSDEVESLGVEQVVENGTTIFHRDPKTGNPILYDYVIKGFLKNACKAMRETDESVANGLSAYKSKIDNLVFAYPRKIKIKNFELEDMGICERPLRASTPQGERVALASSQSIPEGATMTFYVDCLNKSMVDLVLDLMNYGRLNGLGQWHNGGKGRFVYEILGQDNVVIGGNKQAYDDMQALLEDDDED